MPDLSKALISVARVGKVRGGWRASTCSTNRGNDGHTIKTPEWGSNPTLGGGFFSDQVPPSTEHRRVPTPTDLAFQSGDTVLPPRPAIPGGILLFGAHPRPIPRRETYKMGSSRVLICSIWRTDPAANRRLANLPSNATLLSFLRVARRSFELKTTASRPG